MRKLSALFVLIVVFFPLAFAAMTLTSIRPWILHRGFYEGMVNDERLYEALLAEELPMRFNHPLFMGAEQLPVDALSVALREVVTADYLRDQSVSIVNKVFDYFEGRDSSFELSLDFTPIKAALAGEAKSRFAAALAAALPDCAAGEEPIAPGGSLTRCIAAGGSVTAASQQIADALPEALARTPDRIVLNNGVNLQTNWYGFGWLPGGSVATGLDFAIVNMIVIAIVVGAVAAFLGGDHLRGRLKWFSASLFVPASFFLLVGLVLASPLIAGPISQSLAAARWDGVQYSQAYREAVTGVVVPIIQQVGSGFLLTGIVSCLIALALLVWSWATPARDKRESRMVQVPAQNL